MENKYYILAKTVEEEPRYYLYSKPNCGFVSYEYACSLLRSGLIKNSLLNYETYEFSFPTNILYIDGHRFNTLHGHSCTEAIIKIDSNRRQLMNIKGEIYQSWEGIVPNDEPIIDYDIQDYELELLEQRPYIGLNMGKCEEEYDKLRNIEDMLGYTDIVSKTKIYRDGYILLDTYYSLKDEITLPKCITMLTSKCLKPIRGDRLICNNVKIIEKNSLYECRVKSVYLPKIEIIPSYLDESNIIQNIYIKNDDIKFIAPNFIPGRVQELTLDSKYFDDKIPFVVSLLQSNNIAVSLKVREPVYEVVKHYPSIVNIEVIK